MTKLPQGLEYWTLDEVAECLPDINSNLYEKLWRLLEDCESLTPLGGDGSNGTVEYPDARYGTDEDDKARQWWAKLTKDEQATIESAWAKFTREAQTEAEYLKARDDDARRNALGE